MFTGLVEMMCPIRSVSAGGGGRRLEVELGALAEQVKVGDSVAINGVCLTVSRLDGQIGQFELGRETLGRTTLGLLAAGSVVNVELALRAGDRIGGHFVQGHIDGTATVKAVERHGEFADMRFAAGPELLENVVPKGSVAVDGVSLTVVDVNEAGFGVALIPTTLERTTLGKLRVGDKVNIETDIIAKVINKQLSKDRVRPTGLSVEMLKDW